MNGIARSFCLGAAALVCAYSGVSRPASAQNATTTAPESPFSAVSAAGKTLADKGIYFSLGFAEDFSALVSGGQKTGIMPIGHASAGVIFDLETIAGIPGASFHVNFDERFGHSIQEIAGSPIGLLQSDAGPIKPRLSEFYWEQGFDRDRLDITLGRTNPTFDFAVSEISCGFVGVICAQPTSWYSSNDAVEYPSQTWGGRFNFLITPEIYIRAGVFQHDSTAGNFNYSGFDWNTSHSVGAFIPVEIGYQTSFKTAQYPAKYDIGYYKDTASFSKPDGSRESRSAVWAQFQQAVWRPDPGTNRSLTVFGGALVYTGFAPVWGQYYLGVYDRAPFAARPDDTLAFIASLYFNNSASRPNKKTETMFELNYGFSVIPGVTIKPYTQYVISPANGGAALGSKQPDDAWVIGVQAVIDFAQLFNFPQFIPH